MLTPSLIRCRGWYVLSVVMRCIQACWGPSEEWVDERCCALPMLPRVFECCVPSVSDIMLDVVGLECYQYLTTVVAAATGKHHRYDRRSIPLFPLIFLTAECFAGLVLRPVLLIVWGESCSCLPWAWPTRQEIDLEVVKGLRDPKTKRRSVAVIFDVNAILFMYIMRRLM